MVAFADAMTNQSYSYIAPYILSGSALEAEQTKYVTRGISENIDSYEIENVEYTDNNNCVVTPEKLILCRSQVSRCPFLPRDANTVW